MMYDDCFQMEFAARGGPQKRIDAVMALVNQMYAEKDSLETTIEWTWTIEHKRGQNWCIGRWGESGLFNSILPNLARESGRDANIFVFLTGSASKDGLGLAWESVVCDSDKGSRININKYGGNAVFKGQDAYTAEVNLTHRVFFIQ